MDGRDNVSEEQWQAIVDNDTVYDGEFLYGLRTTGIFCKPSCRSRLPNRRNVLIFEDASEAVAAGFRPCKRCKPTHDRLPDQEWADEIARYLELNYARALRLQEIADHCHGSPYHLHRTFKRIKGTTPIEYLQQIRINRARALLQQTSWPISEIAGEVGIPNVSYFTTIFKKMTGRTPAMYRENIQSAEAQKRGQEEEHDEQDCVLDKARL
ncbi:helix-turn-helix domain-containing protein [Xylanibacillus composti]|nr:bifunctional transcriptional activator/DNA repair enzyme AdaA [Xylanibacillus composti]MDT9724869.1 helix-turn-helix domain-containing protein [Xylanibacillus composti]